MRRSLVLLLIAVAFAGAGGVRVTAAAAGAEREYVVIQVQDTAARAQWSSGEAPSLADQGFRRVPVPAGRDASEYAAELAAMFRRNFEAKFAGAGAEIVTAGPRI